MVYKLVRWLEHAGREGFVASSMMNCTVFEVDEGNHRWMGKQ
jgi:hypothetical protein